MSVSRRCRWLLACALAFGAPDRARADGELAEWTVALYLAGDADTSIESACVEALRSVDAGGAPGDGVRVVAMLDRAADPDPSASAADRGGALPLLRELGTSAGAGPFDGQPGRRSGVVVSCVDSTWVGARVVHWTSAVVLPGVRRRCLSADGVLVPPQEAGLGSRATLSAFLSRVLSRHPAKRYAFVLKGHGDAWRGMCIDHSVPGLLSIADVDAALREFARVRGARVDLLVLDGCKMGSVEALRPLASSAANFVASEDALLVRGLPYDVLGALVRSRPARDGTDVATSLVRAYEPVAGVTPTTCGRDRRCGVLASFSADGATAVAEAFDTLGSACARYLAQDEEPDGVHARARGLWRARAAALPLSDPGTYDALSVANELARIPDVAVAWAARRAAAVVREAPLCVSSAPDLATMGGLGIAWSSVSDQRYLAAIGGGEWARFLDALWRAHPCRSDEDAVMVPTEVQTAGSTFVATATLPPDERLVGRVSLVLAYAGGSMRFPAALPSPSDGVLRYHGRFERLQMRFLCGSDEDDAEAHLRECEFSSVEPLASTTLRSPFSAICRPLAVSLPGGATVKYRAILEATRMFVLTPAPSWDPLAGPPFADREGIRIRTTWSGDLLCAFVGDDGVPTSEPVPLGGLARALRGVAMGRGTPIRLSALPSQVDCHLVATPTLVSTAIPSGASVDVWFSVRGDREVDLETEHKAVTVP